MTTPREIADHIYPESQREWFIEKITQALADQIERDAKIAEKFTARNAMDTRDQIAAAIRAQGVGK